MASYHPKSAPPRAPADDEILSAHPDGYPVRFNRPHLGRPDQHQPREGLHDCPPRPKDSGISDDLGSPDRVAVYWRPYPGRWASVLPCFYVGAALVQHRLCFLPEPQGQGSFRRTRLGRWLLGGAI